MDTFKVNAKTSTSSAASSYFRLSPMPNAKLAYEPIVPAPLTSLTITGPLPGGKRLSHPLEVMIEYEDGEVIVSEARFHMHASASTIASAIAAFRRIFSSYLDILSSRESKLDPYLRDQLAYLRFYIAVE